MACDLLTGGIAKGCGVNLGGLKRILITNKENIETDPTVTAGLISSIDLASGELFYEFEFPKNTSFFTEEMTSNLQTGAEFHTQVITLTIPKREATKRETIALLASQRDLIIIVEDMNSTYWYFGYDNGMNLTANTGGSGTAKADLNGYVLTFTGEEPEQAPTVDSTIIAGLLA